MVRVASFMGCRLAGALAANQNASTEVPRRTFSVILCRRGCGPWPAVSGIRSSARSIHTMGAVGRRTVADTLRIAPGREENMPACKTASGEPHPIGACVLGLWVLRCNSRLVFGWSGCFWSLSLNLAAFHGLEELEPMLSWNFA